MAPRIGGQGALVAQPRGVREADALREQRLGARHCARPEPHLPRTRVLRPTPRPRPTIVVQRAQGLQCVRQERWVRPGHGFRHRRSPALHVRGGRLLDPCGATEGRPPHSHGGDVPGGPAAAAAVLVPVRRPRGALLAKAVPAPQAGEHRAHHVLLTVVHHRVQLHAALRLPASGVGHLHPRGHEGGLRHRTGAAEVRGGGPARPQVREPGAGAERQEERRAKSPRKLGRLFEEGNDLEHQEEAQGAR
mmetsp:Transcript_3209/g.11629  ORF Transcript_3209/g.11629 Transcript_3209/m.11629 type:complete len:248 (+) Transcript_3209:295-1038(+)